MGENMNVTLSKSAKDKQKTYHFITICDGVVIVYNSDKHDKPRYTYDIEV